jgi:hypothetical protein
MTADPPDVRRASSRLPPSMDDHISQSRAKIKQLFEVIAHM